MCTIVSYAFNPTQMRYTNMKNFIAAAVASAILSLSAAPSQAWFFEGMLPVVPVAGTTGADEHMSVVKARIFAGPQDSAAGDASE